MDRAIAKAQEKIAFVSRDKNAFRDYQMREMAFSDRTSSLNYVRREGWQEGKQEGKQEGRQEMLSEYILKLFGKGKSVEEISNLTDLPVEDLNKILNNRK